MLAAKTAYPSHGSTDVIPNPSKSESRMMAIGALLQDWESLSMTMDAPATPELEPCIKTCVSVL